jgi:hypothetical protein
MKHRMEYNFGDWDNVEYSHLGGSNLIDYDLTLDSTVPVMDLQSGVEKIGFILNFSVTGVAYSPSAFINESCKVPARFNGPIDVTLGDGVSWMNYDAEIHLSMSVTWDALLPPVGFKRIPVTFDHNISDLITKVDNLEAVISSITGQDGQSWEGRVEEVGGLLTGAGILASFVSGPVGAAIVGIGTLMSMIGETGNAISSGSVVEGIGALIAGLVAGGAVMGGFAKMAQSRKVVNGVKDISAKQAEYLGKVAKRIDAGMDSESLLPKTKYYLGKPIEVDPAKSTIKDKIGHALDKTVASLGLQKAAAKKTDFLPRHGYVVHEWADVSGQDINVLNTVDGKLDPLDGASLQSDIVVKDFVRIESFGKPKGIKDTFHEYANSHRPTGLSELRGQRYYDPNTESWFWNRDPDTFDLGDHGDFNNEYAFDLTNEQFNAFMDVIFRNDNTEGFRLGVDLPDPDLLIEERASSVDPVYLKTFLRQYRAGVSNYDLVFRNCQTYAKEFLDFLSYQKLPKWWDKTMTVNMKLEYTRKLDELLNDSKSKEDLIKLGKKLLNLKVIEKLDEENKQ